MAWRDAKKALGALRADVEALVDAHGGQWRRALTDSSLVALGILRGGDALEAVAGTRLGARTLLRLAFHIDIGDARIDGGLRLPHPFCIVIGHGAEVGSRCVLMHGVTIQRGHARVGEATVLGAHVTVLDGVEIGAGTLVGAGAVVSRSLPPAVVAAGVPAKLLHGRPREAA